MHLYWRFECYACQCPVDPVIRAGNSDNKKFIRYYKRIRPLFTYNNGMYYSFMNSLELKPVCYSCFINKSKISIQDLKDRELGSRRRILPKPKSKTRDEIVYWYEGLVRQAVKHGLDTRK